MNTPHIHCDLIKLWADGNEIQCLVRDTALWLGDSEPTWDEHAKYRVKPEPYEAWVNVYPPEASDTLYPTEDSALAGKGGNCIRTVHVREVEK